MTSVRSSSVAFLDFAQQHRNTHMWSPVFLLWHRAFISRPRLAENWNALMWLLSNSCLEAPLVLLWWVRMSNKSWGQGFMPAIAISHHIFVNVLAGNRSPTSSPWCCIFQDKIVIKSPKMNSWKHILPTDILDVQPGKIIKHCEHLSGWWNQVNFHKAVRLVVGGLHVFKGAARRIVLAVLPGSARNPIFEQIALQERYKCNKINHVS